MRIVVRRDEQGNEIGFDAVDDNGNIEQSHRTSTAIDSGARPALRGEALPTDDGRDYRSPGEKRAAAAAAEAANEKAKKEKEEAEGYTVDASKLDGMRKGKGINPPPKKAAQSNDLYGPAFTGAPRQDAARRRDEDREEFRRKGPLQNLWGGFQRFNDDVTSGVLRAAEGVGDFGAAVLDTMQGKEVNSEDNWFQPSNIIARPNNTAGEIVEGVVEFGLPMLLGTAAVSGVAKAGKFGSSAAAAMQALGGTGLKGSVIRGALSGAAVDFVVADAAQKNFSNAIQDTPLANPVNKFLAADTDKDASFWMNKVKTTVDGIALGVGFDLLGTTVSKVLRNARTAPLEVYLEGVRTTKLLPPAQQEQAMRTLEAQVVTVSEESQRLLRGALEEDVNGRITNARRLLKAAAEPDKAATGSIDIAIEEAPIVAGPAKGDVGVPQKPNETTAKAESERIAEIEESLVGLEDYRKVLYGLESVDTQDKALLESVDETIFQLEDEIFAFDEAYRAVDEVRVQNDVTARRRAEIEQSLAEVDAEIEVARSVPATPAEPEVTPTATATPAAPAVTDPVALKEAALLRAAELEDDLLPELTLKQQDLQRAMKGGDETEGLLKELTDTTEQLQALRKESVELDEKIAKNDFTPAPVADSVPEAAVIPDEAVAPEAIDLGGLTYKPAIPGDEDKLYTVSVDELFNDWQKNGLTELIPGRKENIAKTIDELMASGEPLDAPRVTYGPEGFDISDGRTRISELKERGIKNVQVQLEADPGTKPPTLDRPYQAESPLTALEKRRAELQEELGYLQETPIPGSATPEARVAPGFETTPTRTPQAPPSAAGTSDYVGLEETPVRSPAEYGGTPGSIEQPFVARPDEMRLPFENTPTRQPQTPPPAYRTKPEIRKDVARKQLDAQIAAENPRSPEVTQQPSKGVAGATEGTANKPRRSREEILAEKNKKAPKGAAAGQKVGRKVGVDINRLNNKFNAKQSDAAKDRFMNMNMISDSDDVRATVQAAMDALPNNVILNDLPDARLKKDAYNFGRAVLSLDSEDEMKALIRSYVGNSGNMASANAGLIYMVGDMAEQVMETAKLVSDKRWTDLSITEHGINEKLAHQISKLSMFVEYNKKMSKASGQLFRARGVRLSDDMAQFNIKQAEWDEAHKSVKAGMDDTAKLRNDLSDLVKTPEGQKTFKRIVADLQAAKTPEEVAVAMNTSKFMLYGKNAVQLAQGVRMNGLLSGTRTQETNFLSNFAMSVYTPMTQAVGASIDMVIHRMKGHSVNAEMSRQAAAEAVGTFMGLRRHFAESMKYAGKAFRNGKGILTEDLILKEADRFDMMNPDTGMVLGDVALKALSMPSRGLLFGDEFFKQISYRSNVEARAWQEGLNERGLKGKKLQEFVDKTMTNAFHIDSSGRFATQGMALDPVSREYAEYVTFQTKITEENSSIRNGILGLIDPLRNSSNPAVSFVSTLFFPFVKTPLNIAAYTFRNTPLGFVSKGFREDLAAGGARAARATGEMALGTTAMAGIMALGMDGRLSGRAPRDAKERELWFQDGKQPYSLRISENKWVSFERMEPFAGHFMMLGDMFSAADRADKALEGELQNTMVAITLAFATSMKERSMFEGFSQMMEAFDAFGSADSRDKKVLKTTLEDIGATFLPYSSLSTEFRKTNDNVVRETRGIVDKLMNKIPGMSDNLPAKRNWLTGDPIKYSSSPLMNIYPTSNEKKDPLITKLLKYNTPISPPREVIQKVKLSQQQYEDLVILTGTNKIGGKTQYQALLEVFDTFDTTTLDLELDYLQTNADYASETPLFQALATVRNKYNRSAESALIRMYPDLREDIRAANIEKGDVKRGLFWMHSPLYEGVGYEEVDPTAGDRILDSREDADKAVYNLIEKPGAATVTGEPQEVIE